MIGESRYSGVGTSVVTVSSAVGKPRQVRYQLRRQLTDPGSMVPMAQHRVLADDRLDLIAARYYGDPAAFWRIADANAGLDPDELVGPDSVGSVLIIPVQEG